jgi:protein SCO1/2
VQLPLLSGITNNFYSDLKAISVILFFFIFVSASVSSAFAQSGQMTKEEYAKMIEEVGIEEKLGEMVPMDIILTGEDGVERPLSYYFEKGRPVLLNLIYFNCPSLCNLILNGVTDAMKDLRWVPGKEFEVLTVSIAHDEGHELAAMKKRSYVNALGKPEAADGWHFLTGTEEAIQQLTDAVGYRFMWSDEANEYLHGSAIMFISADGKISRYLYGVQFAELDIRNALFDAANGRVGNTLERIALFCFTYDPDSRSYVPYAMNIMKVGGAVVLITLGVFLGIFWIKERRGSKSEISLDD